MPYISEKLNISGTKYDRRTKLTNEQINEIINLYKNGTSIHELSRLFCVDRITIKYHLPNYESRKKERQDYSMQYSKEHRASGEEWANVMKEHRRYKQKIYLEMKNKDKAKSITLGE